VPIRFRCSHCDKPLALGTRMAGAQLNCPVCGGPVTVPTSQDSHPLPPAESLPLPSPLADPSAPWWIEPPPALINPRAPAVPPPINDPPPVPPPEASTPDAWWVSTGSPTPAHDVPRPTPPLLPPPAADRPTPAPEFSRSPFWQPALAAAGVILLLVIVAVLALVFSPGPAENPRRVMPTTTADDRRSSPPAPEKQGPEDSPAPDPVDPPPQPKKPPAGERPRTELPVRAAPVEPVEKPEVKPDRPEKPLPEHPSPKPGPLIARLPPRQGPIVVRPRRELAEPDLRKQVEKAPEVGLNRSGDGSEARRLLALARSAVQEGRRVEIAPMLVKQRLDLAGLPLRMGDACHLDAGSADHLENGSLALREHLLEASRGSARAGGDTRPNPKKLHDALMADGARHNKWLKPEAIPALLQLLMAENEAIRDVLVDQLAAIDGKRASVALARRALFDLHPGVRKNALVALARRPPEEYVDTLLEGFRYPWAPVADHAAEALIALDLRETVPALIRLLDQPDPGQPYVKPGRDGQFVRELVRINHLHNCLLCHAPSLAPTDKVRGFVPTVELPLPPAFTRAYYKANRPGVFVRADVTYLQQDFSLPLPVKDPGKWPTLQRYDFLVRERPATVADVQARRAVPAPSEHQLAIFHALRELTGTDPGPTVEDWKHLFLRGAEVALEHTGMRSAAGVAVDEQGAVYLADAVENVVLQVAPGGRPGVWVSGSGGARGLALDGKGRLIACQRGAGKLMAYDLRTRAAHLLADKHQGKSLHGPTHLTVDHQGGIYFSDAPPARPNGGPTDRGAVYYLSAHGTLTRLAIALARPAGLALSPDDKTLYVVGGEGDVMAYPLEGAGLPVPGKMLCRLEAKAGTAAHGAGLTVDGRGNLYLANPAVHALQVVNPGGARLGLISLPEPPLDCTAAGPERRTLHVTSAHSLFTVRLDK
jgi:gluconolactonase